MSNPNFPNFHDTRQPVHVVYGGAQLFTAETPSKVSKLALKTLEDFAGTDEEFNRCLDLDPQMDIRARVKRKLESEAVEDYRIDFEDGYGSRPDEEEDADAVRVAGELAAAFSKKTLPPYIGIRIKSLSDESHNRSTKTLNLFIDSFVKKTNGKLPDGFLITLPKVESVAQISTFVQALQSLEKKNSLTPGSLRFEAMLETPQLLMNRQGVCELPLLRAAAQERLVAVHFGAYDYTGALDVTAAHQTLAHPSCDFARQMMKLAFAGTEVRLSDGATNVMPIGPHRAKPGQTLSEGEIAENRAVVHRAWRMSFSDIQRSLIQGFYQGWDLHPAQIPVRYAAVYTFFQKSHASASARLKNFVERAAQATLVGNVFDDAASGQGLLNFFLRGLSCGALTEAEVLATGLTLDELRSKSFLKIAQSRSARS